MRCMRMAQDRSLAKLGRGLGPALFFGWYDDDIFRVLRQVPDDYDASWIVLAYLHSGSSRQAWASVWQAGRGKPEGGRCAHDGCSCSCARMHESSLLSVFLEGNKVLIDKVKNSVTLFFLINVTHISVDIKKYLYNWKKTWIQYFCFISTFI